MKKCIEVQLLWKFSLHAQSDVITQLLAFPVVDPSNHTLSS